MYTPDAVNGFYKNNTSCKLGFPTSVVSYTEVSILVCIYSSHFNLTGIFWRKFGGTFYYYELRWAFRSFCDTYRAEWERIGGKFWNASRIAVVIRNVCEKIPDARNAKLTKKTLQVHTSSRLSFVKRVCMHVEHRLACTSRKWAYYVM